MKEEGLIFKKFSILFEKKKWEAKKKVGIASSHNRSRY